MSDWFRKLVTKVIRVGGSEQINQPALNLVAGPGVQLTAQNREIEGETRVTISRTSSEADAAAVDYDNGQSGLSADNVQDALDELVAAVPTALPRQLFVNQGPLNGPADDAVTMGSNAVLARVGDGDIASLGAATNTLLGRAAGNLQAIALPENSLCLRGSGDFAAVGVSEGSLVGRPTGLPLSQYPAAAFGLATTAQLAAHDLAAVLDAGNDADGDSIANLSHVEIVAADDETVALTLESGGGNSGVVEHRVGDRNPDGTISGNPGDIYHRTSTNSGKFVNVGTTPNNTSWRPLLRGSIGAAGRIGVGASSGFNSGSMDFFASLTFDDATRQIRVRSPDTGTGPHGFVARTNGGTNRGWVGYHPDDNVLDIQSTGVPLRLNLWTLPAADGDAGNSLVTNGSGQLGWARMPTLAGVGSPGAGEIARFSSNADELVGGSTLAFLNLVPNQPQLTVRSGGGINSNPQGFVSANSGGTVRAWFGYVQTDATGVVRLVATSAPGELIGDWQHVRSLTDPQYRVHVAPLGFELLDIAHEDSDSFQVAFTANQSHYVSVLVSAISEAGNEVALRYKLKVTATGSALGYESRIVEVYIDDVEESDPEGWESGTPQVYVTFSDSTLDLTVTIHNEVGQLINARAFVNVESYAKPAAPTP